MTKSRTLIVAAPDEQEIIKESQHWIRGNHGVKVSGTYSSPRISSEIADCSMPLTFDHYNYCSLGCLYCFAYFFKSNNPSSSKGDISLKAINPDQILNNIQGLKLTKSGRLHYEHFYKRKFLLHWGGLADPFCTFEKYNQVGLRLLQGLGDLNYPTLLSFKGSTVFEEPYLKLFQNFSNQGNFAFQVSIVTGSDKLAALMEIGVPSPTRRLEAIKTLSSMGYWTILRLRPFILGVTNVGLDDLLHRALEAGIKGVSTEFFAADARANIGMKTRYAWIAKQMGVPNNDLMAYYKATSPSERGGYMRGNRLIKEPYIKQIYKFCTEHGLVCGISDPDFKELNTSGSCCGMPDNFPKNRLLQNWTRNQLTYHLKQARIAYHKTGQCPELQFNQVYGAESYLDCKELANDHVTVIGRMCSVRYELTQRIILQEQWNNLNSPSNPRNYFNGKLMPVGVDENGNFVYRYNPMAYEAEWSSEGIDLTV
jgi:DNA repair photolyase